MHRLSEADALVFACVFVAVNTLMLLGLLSILRPRDGGYFARWIWPRGTVVCFAASVLFTVLPLFDVPAIVSIVLWWVVALAVFRLTVRQAFKLNIAGVDLPGARLRPRGGRGLTRREVRLPA